jgi:hypothetical protein
MSYTARAVSGSRRGRREVFRSSMKSGNEMESGVPRGTSSLLELGRRVQNFDVGIEVPDVVTRGMVEVKREK